MWKSVRANLKFLHAVSHLWCLAVLCRFSPKHQLIQDKNIKHTENCPLIFLTRSTLLTWIISATFCSPLVFRKTPGPAKNKIKYTYMGQCWTDKQKVRLYWRISWEILTPCYISCNLLHGFHYRCFILKVYISRLKKLKYEASKEEEKENDQFSLAVVHLKLVIL